MIGAVTAQVAVSGGRRFVTLGAGENHACAVTLSGEAWCWGSSVYGKLGDDYGGPTTVPVLVAGNIRWQRVTAANNYTCAPCTTDALYCWGRNARGQLGTGTPAGALAPVAVHPLAG